jgi:hypothetical protein
LGDPVPLARWQHRLRPYLSSLLTLFVPDGWPVRRLVSICHAAISSENTMELLRFISNQSGDTLRAGGDIRDKGGKLKSQMSRFRARDAVG